MCQVLPAQPLSSATLYGIGGFYISEQAGNTPSSPHIEKPLQIVVFIRKKKEVVRDHDGRK